MILYHSKMNLTEMREFYWLRKFKKDFKLKFQAFVNISAQASYQPLRASRLASCTLHLVPSVVPQSLNIFEALLRKLSC